MTWPEAIVHICGVAAIVAVAWIAFTVAAAITASILNVFRVKAEGEEE